MPFPTEVDCVCGPLIPDLLLAPIVADLDELSVRLVDDSVPQTIRCKVAHVAMVAQRSMPRYPAGYDGTVTKDDQRLYVLAAEERVIAFVLTALDKRFWHLSWRVDCTIELLQKKALSHRGPKVCRVWVATNQRRRGFSARLIEVATQHLDVEVSALGWELPLSPDGMALVRYILPSSFYGCGDRYALGQAINPQAIHRK